MRKLSLDELGRKSVAEFHKTEKLPVCILLDNIRSLHNVGSVFRTADAFRIEKILLTGITGTPPHREIHKTALGATESVAWEYAHDAVQAVGQLKDAGYKIIVVEQTDMSKPLHQFPWKHTEKYCLVLGNEVHGVQEALVAAAHDALEIPQEGTKHSLNVSVCTGIVCWEIFKQIGLSLALPQ